VYQIDRARKEDIESLLSLYFSIYGDAYPLELGTNRRVMMETILSPDNLWLVSRDTAKNTIAGSVVISIDRFNKIGKVQGLATHPNYRGQGIAQDLIATGTNRILVEEKCVNSIYATSRTNAVGVQLVFLKNGFIPLGICPNAHKLKEYETLTLFAKFQKNILSERKTRSFVPEKLAPIMQVLGNHLNTNEVIDTVKSKKPVLAPACEIGTDFDVIFAPAYVKRKFNNTFTDAYDRFYPFHEPNTLIASEDGELEVYANINKNDQYCAIISITDSFKNIPHYMKRLLATLQDYGASYVETIISTSNIESIEVLLDAQFLPSAVYPAMQERNGNHMDFVLMSRTMKPLNFKGMEIASDFKPYVDQYVDLWKKMHIDTLEIFNEYT